MDYSLLKSSPTALIRMSKWMAICKWAHLELFAKETFGPVLHHPAATTVQRLLSLMLHRRRPKVEHFSTSFTFSDCQLQTPSKTSVQGGAQLSGVLWTIWTQSANQCSACVTSCEHIKCDSVVFIFASNCSHQRSCKVLAGCVNISQIV